MNKQNKNGITLIALIITIIVMLILVGVTVTAAINGGLFSSAKEGAKGTTIARVKEQITADIATEIAERTGEKITKSDLKQIVKQYGTLDENEENLTLKDTNYTVPLTDIWNDFDEFKLNDHGYYENCIYGTEVYKKYRQYFTEEQQKELDQYLPDFETKMYYAFNAGIKGGVSERKDINKWYTSEEFLQEEGTAYFAVFKGTEMYVYYAFDTEAGKEAGYSNMINYQKDERKGVLYCMDMRK
ncbi:MAG: hypothetical protein ACI4UX_04775 [Clostridia bacterium]